MIITTPKLASDATHINLAFDFNRKQQQTTAYTFSKSYYKMHVLQYKHMYNTWLVNVCICNVFLTTYSSKLLYAVMVPLPSFSKFCGG